MGFHIEFDDSGMEKFKKNLKSMAKKVKGEVQIRDLCHAEFMKENTDYDNIDSFAEASGVDFSNPEEAIERPEWNSFVRENSSFESWNDMLKAAVRKYIEDKLQQDR